MLSRAFAAALDGWTAAILQLHEAELEGLDPDALLADVGEIAGRIADMIPAGEEDRGIQAYVARHWPELEQGLIDGDNPFWLEVDMDLHLSPTVRLLVAFRGQPFSGAEWLREWRAAGGIACTVDQPGNEMRIFLGHKREGGRALDRPSAAELRHVLCQLLTDDPARGAEIEAVLHSEGAVEIDAWPGPTPAACGSATKQHREEQAHA